MAEEGIPLSMAIIIGAVILGVFIFVAVLIGAILLVPA